MNDPVLVLQHAKGRTLELAIGPATAWMAGREGEVYEHLANTQDGSSGSPCFSFGWTLLALHHRVEPVAGGRNRAVASAAILSLAWVTWEPSGCWPRSRASGIRLWQRQVAMGG